MKEKKLLTSGQVAEICQVSVPTVLNWINSDYLPSYKTAGGHNRISPLALLRFLSSRGMFVPEDLYQIVGVKPEEFNMKDSKQKPVAIVADDDQTLRSLLRDVLEGGDYMVVEVEDGLNACLQLGLLRPELLILDILMPEMDGLQVLQTIIKQPDLQSTKIIVVSGVIDDALRKQLQDLGVEHIMQKPVRIMEFVRVADIGPNFTAAENPTT